MPLCEICGCVTMCVNSTYVYSHRNAQLCRWVSAVCCWIIEHRIAISYHVGGGNTRPAWLIHYTAVTEQVLPHTMSDSHTAAEGVYMRLAHFILYIQIKTVYLQTHFQLCTNLWNLLKVILHISVLGLMSSRCCLCGLYCRQERLAAHLTEWSIVKTFINHFWFLNSGKTFPFSYPDFTQTFQLLFQSHIVVSEVTRPSERDTQSEIQSNPFVLVDETNDQITYFKKKNDMTQ